MVTSARRARRSRAKDIQTLLILGASGDLTGRLLLPGLASLVTADRAPGLRLVGAGAESWTPSKWQRRLAKSLPLDADADATARWKELAATSVYHSLDVTAKGELAAFLKTLDGPVAVFFALPPRISQAACESLSPEDVPFGTRLVLEKPFGSDAASARELNETLRRLVPEDHIHRVDHFLGKGMVLNILGMRFANRFLEPLLNRDHVAEVEIIFDEDLALEGRAGYYDRAGALRDMIQSHLLQIMALMAMEPPATLHERDLRDGIATVLRASRVATPFRKNTRRARYTAGRISGRKVPDYVAEEGVDPDRLTETFAEVRLEINNSRWSGVPFILRSGKAMGTARKEAVVRFRPLAHLPAGFTGTDEPDELRIGFGPDTLSMTLDVTSAGNAFELSRAELTTELHSSALLPYGEVLDGVLHGDPLLSVRDDVAEDCWRIVDPVLSAWSHGRVPLEDYPAGSGGPAADA
ncbi:MULTISPECIES: glucose-6-phosphate dehydrogenase [Arthrobacter]|uniref:Glucose-6-phosphate 1-dehydrogenase n=2 Tax=Arthrobacter TaxID=1663 RepID=A0ABU9KFA8_9MICC|nr:glucose-6-phosphate dehydrogenase [Arthrobacter sp. YJM1]MDP5225566.1 glucose-6-phosphate dehydrogenase [Arthrobacter sp. YJM1]